VQLLIVLSTLGLMFFYSAKLMLVSLLGAMLSLAILAVTLPVNRRFGAEALIHGARQSSSIMQTLRGAASVQSLGIASVRLTDWQKHFFEATNARVQQSKISIMQGTAGGIIAASEQLLFLGIGINGVVEKEITLGVLFAYMSLRGRFAGAASGLAVVVQRLFILRTHTDRVSDILLAKPQFNGGEIDKSVRGAIGARDLGFGYPGGRNIIEGFNCDITAGSTVVITGPSGCGKTTLLQLLSARLEPVKGFVLVDDIRARMWRTSALRQRLTVVMQDDYLFQGSIAENICAFDPAPDLLRIRNVASLAEIWADIEEMPMMHNTLIDDSASVLSGGQRQRILLARALYQNPAVLFLDEATSQLDVATEERVLNNLQGLGMTLISVAHRPDVINRAGHIISLS
jgi:ATP-binding cassette subfamily B protein RaxB